MGGDYYDRPVISVADGLFGNDVMDQKGLVLDPRERKIQMGTDALNPIVFGLDVTGSMGVWIKVIRGKCR